MLQGHMSDDMDRLKSVSLQSGAMRIVSPALLGSKLTIQTPEQSHTFRPPEMPHYLKIEYKPSEVIVPQRMTRVFAGS